MHIQVFHSSIGNSLTIGYSLGLFPDMFGLLKFWEHFNQNFWKTTVLASKFVGAFAKI